MYRFFFFYWLGTSWNCNVKANTITPFIIQFAVFKFVIA